MSALEEQFLLFKINEEEEIFNKIHLANDPIYTALDPLFIFIIVEPKEKLVWIWHGEKASIRKKFIATQKAPEIRDQYGVDFKITAIDQGSEPPEFKKFVGL